jgi:hypothetical protein
MRARYPRTGVRECHYVGMIYADRNKYCTTCVLREYCNTYFALVAGAGRRCTTVCTYACVAFAISSECRSVCVALVAGAGRRCTYICIPCVCSVLTYLLTYIYLPLLTPRISLGAASGGFHWAHETKILSSVVFFSDCRRVVCACSVCGCRWFILNKPLSQKYGIPGKFPKCG